MSAHPTVLGEARVDPVVTVPSRGAYSPAEVRAFASANPGYVVLTGTGGWLPGDSFAVRLNRDEVLSLIHGLAEASAAAGDPA